MRDGDVLGETVDTFWHCSKDGLDMGWIPKTMFEDGEEEEEEDTMDGWTD